jgi:hypothetical protein
MREELHVSTVIESLDIEALSRAREPDPSVMQSPADQPSGRAGATAYWGFSMSVRVLKGRKDHTPNYQLQIWRIGTKRKARKKRLRNEPRSAAIFTLQSETRGGTSPGGQKGVGSSIPQFTVAVAF